MHDLVDWLTHMNWVDYLFLTIIVYSIVAGAWLGFMAECVSLLGVAAGTLVAGITYNGLGQGLGHLGVRQDARDWAGFVAAFLILSLIFRVAAVLARNISKVMVRGRANNIAGALLGLLVGSMICMFMLVTVAYFRIWHFYDPLLHSKIAAQSSEWLKEYVGLLPKEMQSLPPFTKS